MRTLLLALALCTTLIGRGQLNNWDPSWYPTDSTLVFHDDLDYYLNAYSKTDIKGMRKQVSIWRMNFDKLMRLTIKELRTYSEGGGMDPHTHDFTLPVAQDGTTYSLGANDGKVRAFMFGSITNPPSRVQMERWSRLLKKYAQEDVQLFVVYGEELHPGDTKSFRSYPKPKSEYEKMAYAKEFAQLGQLPVLVDGLNNATFDAYGKAPNGAYLIDKDGNLVFRGTWADARKIEHMIDTLLKWYKAGKPKGYAAQ
ncbi:MAG: redoxin domain-containing protein [Flavobacteriales bacterium]|nr:redoxin domain-containing protein [Flavobacteriales bacterium]